MNQCIIIYGVTFKADIDDVRNSPAMNILIRLKEKFKKLKVVEPNVSEEKIKGVDNLLLNQAESMRNIIKIKLVNHHEFTDVKFDLEYC